MIIFNPLDYRENRVPAAIGYLIFFVPLLVCPRSALGRYAANQGLLGFLATLAVVVAFWMLNLFLGWIPLLGTLIHWAGYLCRLAIVAAMIWRGVCCLLGEAKSLPFIGEVELLH